MYPITLTDWNRCRASALDLGFNAAVLTIAARLFPCGFDIGPDAPQTYEQLMHCNAGRRMRVVDDGVQRTIFGDAEVSAAFRAWRAWCHWRERFDFSAAGERAVCTLQAEHFVTLYGESEQIDEWRRILHAEIIGQREHCDRTGAFPVDQRAFVEAYLAAESSTGYNVGSGKTSPRASARHPGGSIARRTSCATNEPNASAISTTPSGNPSHAMS
jgi:hypothetical protein